MSSEGPNVRQASIRVWALLGAHRGDNNQILALARALDLEFAEIPLSYNWLRLLPPALLGATFASLDEESRTLVGGEPPDLVISTGLRSVPVVRELKRRSGGRMRAVHLGYPRISPRHFDLVVSTPEYPVPDAPNVLRIPFALTPHRERPVERSDRELLNAFPRPRRLMLIGGPTLYWRLSSDGLTAAVRQLLSSAETEGGSILAVGSPRTPAGLLGAIHTTLQSSPVPFMFEPGDGPPAYPALIEAADEIFVTADSVAMVADAVTTGKPVGIVPIDKSRLGRALMFVMDRLRPGRHLRPRDLRFFWAALRREGFGGSLDQPRASNPPDYLAEVAMRVRRLLGLADPPATIARDSDR
jgi:mitochondrial fission protein ELM1